MTDRCFVNGDVVTFAVSSSVSSRTTTLVLINSIYTTSSVHARPRRALVDVDGARVSGETCCACALECVDEIRALTAVEARLRLALVDVD